MIVLFSAWHTIVTQSTVRYVKKKTFQMKSKSHQAFEHKASECATTLFFFAWLISSHLKKPVCIFVL